MRSQADAQEPAPTPEQRKREFITAINKTISGECRDEAMTQEEWSSVQAFQRALALRNSAVWSSIRYCHVRQDADATQAVLTLITSLSDNNDGSCYLGEKRIAEALNRSVRRIRDCIKRLEDAQLITVERKPGKPCRFKPVVVRALKDTGASPVWFVDAVSKPPRRRGRPPKPKSADVTVLPFPLEPSRGQKTPDAFEENPGRQQFRPNNDNPREYREKRPIENHGTLLSKDSTDEEEERERRSFVVAIASEGQLGRYWQLATSWGQAADKTISRSKTDASLAGMLQAYRQKSSPDLIAQALEEALAYCEMGVKATGSNGAASFASYFSKVLSTKLRELEAAGRDDQLAAETSRKTAKIRLETEEQIAAKRLVAFESSAAAGAAKREAAAKPSAHYDAEHVTGPDGRLQFNRRTKSVEQVAGNFIAGKNANRALERARELWESAEPRHVEQALFDATGFFNKGRGTDVQPVDTRQIVRRVGEKAAVLAAYEEMGLPETFSGGPVASYKWVRTPFQSDWAVLSQDFVDGLIDRHPKYFERSDSGCSIVKLEDVAQHFRDFVRKADTRKYGTALQREIEAQIEAYVAEKDPYDREEASERDGSDKAQSGSEERSGTAASDPDEPTARAISESGPPRKTMPSASPKFDETEEGQACFIKPLATIVKIGAHEILGLHGDRALGEARKHVSNIGPNEVLQAFSEVEDLFTELTENEQRQVTKENLIFAAAEAAQRKARGLPKIECAVLMGPCPTGGLASFF